MSSSPSKNGQGGIALYLVDSRGLSASDLACFEASLEDASAQRLARFVREERRHQFVLGRVLLRLAACRWYGLTWNEVAIDEGSVRPELRIAGDRRLVGSISHSRYWIACAVADHDRLGLDIELVDDLRDVAALAQMGLDATEAQWVLQKTGLERIDAFYQVWCMKEALYKMSGVSTLPPLARSSAADEVSCFHVVPHPELKIVVCTDSPIHTPKATVIADLASESRHASIGICSKK